jgi:hypothetical protein
VSHSTSEVELSLSLDGLYRELNGIYIDANFYRDEYHMFSHLVEIVGALSDLASSKKKPGFSMEKYMPKACAWWIALAGKVGVRSVETMIWYKYPYICPYCRSCPHIPGVCDEEKANNRGPRWDAIEQNMKANSMPSTLAEWQRMFYKLYPPQSIEQYDQVFARLAEEMGELAEAVRVRRYLPGYFVSEASDVFAWLMHLQNLYQVRQWGPTIDFNVLSGWIAAAYPGGCSECMQAVCVCPAVVDSTLGRIGHEIPEISTKIESQAILPVDVTIKRFQTRSVSLGRTSWEVGPKEARELKEVVDQILAIAIDGHANWNFLNKAVIDMLYSVKHMSAQSGPPQQYIEEVVEIIAKLPDDSHNQLSTWANSLNSEFVTWLLRIATKAVGHHFGAS